MSRGRTKQCLLWLNEKWRRRKWNKQKAAESAALLQWRKVARKKHKRKRKRRREGRRGQWREELGMKSLKKVIAGIKDKGSAHDDAKATAQRTAGQRVKQTCTARKLEIKKSKKRNSGKRGPDGSATG